MVYLVHAFTFNKKSLFFHLNVFIYLVVLDLGCSTRIFSCGIPTLRCGFPGDSDGKSICLQCRRLGFNPWVGKIPWSRKWQPTPVFLPGKSHRQRSLVGYSPWGLKESDWVTSLSLSTLRCSMWDPVPWPGIKLGPLHWEHVCVC